MQNTPVNHLAMEEMAEQVGQVSDLIGFLIEDVIVVLEERSLKELLELVIVDAEAFSQQAKKSLVDALHHAAFENHIDQLMLITFGDVHFEDLVRALLKVHGGLDG